MYHHRYSRNLTLLHLENFWELLRREYLQYFRKQQKNQSSKKLLPQVFESYVVLLHEKHTPKYM